jgi:hypothetical protein
VIILSMGWHLFTRAMANMSIRMIWCDVMHLMDLYGLATLCAISLPRRVPLCCCLLPTVASSPHCVSHSIELVFEQALRQGGKCFSSKRLMPNGTRI